MIDQACNTLSDWLSYFEFRHLEPIQLGLERVRTVAERLELALLNATVITVAGTNGKGSTVAALTAIYQAAGYCVATYTSPHLLNFNERICVNQTPISDDDLCTAFRVIHATPESRDLTYFEMATLAALWHFKKVLPEVIILEVGMGGRLDATNIIDADVSVITTIDFDHMAFLGDSREKIGYEKAGIMRKNKPLVYADINPPESIRAYAKTLESDEYIMGEYYSFNVFNDFFVLSLSDYTEIRLPKPSINCQAMAAALVVSIILNPCLPVTNKDWVSATSSVSIKGRLQEVVIDGVTHLFDVAHNPQAVRLLVDYLANKTGKGNIYAIFSGLKDKDLYGLIKPMEPLVYGWYPALLDGPRAADRMTLQKAFGDAINQYPECYADPVLAYQAVKKVVKPGDYIVVYGSFLTVSAVMTC